MAQSGIEKPEACTCGRLRRITRRVTQIYDQFLAPSGLTIAQFGILGRVIGKRGINIGALADMLVMDPTTLSRNLRPLVRNGYLKLDRDPADQRRQLVSITERGKAVATEALPHWNKAQAHVASLVGDDDTARLERLIDRSLVRLGAP
jgi:DNA-binding MarR family transcriptional regulator